MLTVMNAIHTSDLCALHLLGEDSDTKTKQGKIKIQRKYNYCNSISGTYVHINKTSHTHTYT